MLAPVVMGSYNKEIEIELKTQRNKTEITKKVHLISSRIEVSYLPKILQVRKTI